MHIFIESVGKLFSIIQIVTIDLHKIYIVLIDIFSGTSSFLGNITHDDIKNGGSQFFRLFAFREEHPDIEKGAKGKKSY